jgi:hypothetical protein
MRKRGSIHTAAIIASVLVVACSSGGAGVGSPCDSTTQCVDELQCLEHTCQPRCQRAPDCGDGYACSDDGLCILGEASAGDRCTSEVECAPGLACVLDVDDGGDGVLDASCTADRDGGANGAACSADAECRNGTCALGRCVDLCAIDRDCISGSVCTGIPRVDNAASTPTSVGNFRGCLPANATLAWTIETSGTESEVFVPVPELARTALAVMSVDDETQFVGASRLLAPDGTELYQLDPDVIDPFDPDNLVRHTPTMRRSVLMMPSRPEVPLVTGAYQLTLGSYRMAPLPAPHLVPGSSTPSLTTILKLGDGSVLDVHFYFLDLADHPCLPQLGEDLNATSASTPHPPTDEYSGWFQERFLGQLRVIFARAAIALGTVTYDDITGHPELDGLDSENLSDLLELATHPGGVNVFFVRTIAPVGLQALVGSDKNPGDPTPGSPIGGVAVAVDTMCYRSWEQFARVTAHAIAREMALYRNLEPAPFDTFEDPIADSPGAENPTQALDNLMHFSEFGGTSLTPEQREILRRSATLR